MADELNLHTLKPVQERKDRKRVGRGLGSGKGRYSGRGIKGQKSRSGSHSLPAGFEGGQMPINLRDLDRFAAGTEVTPEVLKQAGLIGSLRKDVKILGSGELSKKLAVSAHGFSKSAREKIEAAGGSVSWLRGEPVERKPKKAAPKPKAEEREEPEPEEPEAAPEAESEPEE